VSATFMAFCARYMAGHGYRAATALLTCELRAGPAAMNSLSGPVVVTTGLTGRFSLRKNPFDGSGGQAAQD